MPPKFGGGGNKCKRCNKTVYQAEEKKDPKGGYWHSSCFTCKNCPNNNKSTRLDSTNINIHEGTYHTRPLLQPNRIRVLHNFQFSIKSMKTEFSRQRNWAGPLSAHPSCPLAMIFACSPLDSGRIHWKLLLRIALVQTCPVSFPGPLA